MHDPSDAPELEPYRRALAAIFEVVQVLLTLHTVTTLDARNMASLVVESISALLDDLQRGHITSQRLSVFRRPFGLRLAIRTAGVGREAATYRRLDEATRGVEAAFSRLTAARIDALTAETRSNLDHAIRSIQDAFRQLATPEGADDLALRYALKNMTEAINNFSRHLDSLGHQRTLGVPDSTPSRVLEYGMPPERVTGPAGTQTRDALGRPAHGNPRRATDPFNP
jgi:hypothetical protein